MKKAAAALAALFALPVLIGATASGTGVTTVDREAVSDIPARYLHLYVEAAGRFGIDWQVLAAVGKVECDHGRGDCYRPNHAGAMGPMQFLAGTWERYRTASREPPYDVYDARDSIFAAAAKLSADGIARDVRAALFSYNRSHAYVDDVLAWAARYGWLGDRSALEVAVLSHPNIGLRLEARADIEGGLIDRRVLAALLVLAGEHRLDAVGPLVSGHSLYVAGTTRISNHAVGRAVDIPIVDGVAVSSSNARARAVAKKLLALPPPLRPDELGSPWDFAAPGAFRDSAHERHIHAGWSGGG